MNVHMMQFLEHCNITLDKIKDNNDMLYVWTFNWHSRAWQKAHSFTNNITPLKDVLDTLQKQGYILCHNRRFHDLCHDPVALAKITITCNTICVLEWKRYAINLIFCIPTGRKRATNITPKIKLYLINVSVIDKTAKDYT